MIDEIGEFLIRDDEVQVDKAIYILRLQIQTLKSENAALKTENIQLKNRPDTAYDPPKPRLEVMVTKDKINIDELPIEKWQARHFLMYFMRKYTEKYSQPIKFHGKAFQGGCIRIHQFVGCHPQINKPQDFKSFIDWMFKFKFNKQFTAAIPLITSETMLYQWVATLVQKPSLEKMKQAAAKVPRSTKDIDDLIKEVF